MRTGCLQAAGQHVWLGFLTGMLDGRWLGRGDPAGGGRGLVWRPLVQEGVFFVGAPPCMWAEGHVRSPLWREIW